MEMENNWHPFIWYKVDIETYKVIYQEAKERFEETASESESITNKTIRVLIANAVMASFFVSFYKDIPTNKSAVLNFTQVILLVLLIINTIKLVSLLFPKNIILRGIEPRQLYLDDLDDDTDDNREYQQQKVYYRCIGLLERNIDNMYKKNKERAQKYKCTLILSTILFIIGILSIGSNI